MSFACLAMVGLGLGQMTHMRSMVYFRGFAVEKVAPVEPVWPVEPGGFRLARHGGIGVG